MAFGPDLRSPRLIEADPLITTGLTLGSERPQVCSRIPEGMSVCVHVCGAGQRRLWLRQDQKNPQLGTHLPLGVATN